MKEDKTEPEPRAHVHVILPRQLWNMTRLLSFNKHCTAGSLIEEALRKTFATEFATMTTTET